ncbi:MAG: HlyD family efflux transporter periplasmic adaptor subunit [Phycisphaerales bacterium]|nr:HlyD family efflux transporter periplasmic adaptor subunit [Phycisphaerales bacterium]
MSSKEFEIHAEELVSARRDELRAPEANEMLERTPTWLLRWGVFSIMIVFGIIILISVVVKYPDTLEGSAVITTDPLPIKLKSISGGRITQLFVADGAIVSHQTPIAEIENPTGYANILHLQNTIDSINVYLQTNNETALEVLVNHPLQSLGDAQAFYNQLLQQLSARALLHKEQLYNKRTQNLQQQIGNLQSIAQISKQERAMIEEELKQADDRFKANEQLYKDRVISKQEYYDEAAKLRSKKLQLEQQKRNGIQNNISSNDNSKQMLDMQYEREEKERTLTVGIQEAMRNLSNYIQTWKQRYLLVAPYNGTIQYLRPLQINEPTNAGEELFAVVPQQSKYLAVTMLPANGIGKVEIGQNVHLLLDNFPYNEFGFLEGKIIKRSTLPEAPKGNANGQAQQGAMYRIYVQLSDTLVTSYRKTIPFNPEMTATARIITKDRNLLQRLIAGVAKMEK